MKFDNTTPLHSHCLFQVQFPVQYRPLLSHWSNTWLEPKLAKQKHSNQCPNLCLILLVISIGVLRRITIDHHANSCTRAITTLFKGVHTEPSPASVYVEFVLFLFIVDKPLVFHLLRGQSVLDRSHVLLSELVVQLDGGVLLWHGFRDALPVYKVITLVHCARCLHCIGQQCLVWVCLIGVANYKNAGWPRPQAYFSRLTITKETDGRTDGQPSVRPFRCVREKLGLGTRLGGLYQYGCLVWPPRPFASTWYLDLCTSHEIVRSNQIAEYV